ncbi:MAG TPA: acyl--CoA ligase [Tessaracoccus flavescens]|uniref:Acyl--CoA ligase n=1 Tax=Tessaracoccus flavescens TaxID=399497 RepID=A0A921ELG9_9ACTN|nr:acyl--CoA ligase [Tessaracoccus flavescens]
MLRGPGTFAGYFRDDAATERARTTDGWLRTGDLASRDDDGYYCVLDRIDDLHISGGENVSPSEVEDVLRRHAAVDRVAVVDVPDERWGQVGVAYVVKRAGVVTDAEDLIAHCRLHMAAFKVPARFVFVDEVPMGSSSKVSRHSLKEAAR